MATLAPERVEEQVISLRRGLDLDGFDNPAGSLFTDSYREHEITMTGTPFTDDTATTNDSVYDWNCQVYCCLTP
jgi:hypothetical protein